MHKTFCEQQNLDLSFPTWNLELLRALKGWKGFKQSDSPHVFRCSFCRFGTPCRKKSALPPTLRYRGYECCANVCNVNECFGRLFGLRPLFPLLLCIVSIRKSGWGICISATSLVFWFGCLSPFEYASNPTCWLYSEQEIVFWLRSILNWFTSIAKDRAFELHRPRPSLIRVAWDAFYLERQSQSWMVAQRQAQFWLLRPSRRGCKSCPWEVIKGHLAAWHSWKHATSVACHDSPWRT